MFVLQTTKAQWSIIARPSLRPRHQSKRSLFLAFVFFHFLEFGIHHILFLFGVAFFGTRSFRGTGRLLGLGFGLGLGIHLLRPLVRSFQERVGFLLDVFLVVAA